MRSNRFYDREVMTLWQSGIECDSDDNANRGPVLNDGLSGFVVIIVGGQSRKIIFDLWQHDNVASYKDNAELESQYL